MNMLEGQITFDKFIRWILIVLGIVFVMYLLNILSSVLLPFFIAWFLAYLIYPLVKFIENKMHIKVRALSIALAILFILLLASGVTLFVIPPMIEQFDKLDVLITNYLHQKTHSNSLGIFLQELYNKNKTHIDEFLKSKDFTETFKSIMPKAFNILGQTASCVISIMASFITLLYMFFILYSYEEFRANWIKIFPKKFRPFWKELISDAEGELSKYIRGQSLVSLTEAILFAVAFTIIDFPMAIAMGVLIGILNMVPYLHTLAIIPGILLALLKSVDTGQNIWIVLAMMLAVFAIVQVLMDLLVTPRIMGKTMGLHPAILLLSLSIWGTLLGFIGLIIALPLTTLIIAYWKRYVTKEEDKEYTTEKTHQK